LYESAGEILKFMILQKKREERQQSRDNIFEYKKIIVIHGKAV